MTAQNLQPVSPPTPPAGRIRLLRFCAVAGAIIAFLGLASVINPASSTAVTLGPPAQGPAPIPLGTLECDRFVVRIFAGADGEQLYSVYDAAGREIGIMLRADELYRIDPILDPESWLATPLSEAEITDDY